MKKVLLMLVAIMAFGLISCGDNKPTGEPKGDAEKYVNAVLDAVKEADSAKAMDAKIDEILKEFQEAYKDAPEKWAEFGKEVPEVKVPESALEATDKLKKEEIALVMASAIAKAQLPLPKAEEKKAEEKPAE